MDHENVMSNSISIFQGYNGKTFPFKMRLNEDKTKLRLDRLCVVCQWQSEELVSDLIFPCAAVCPNNSSI